MRELVNLFSPHELELQSHGDTNHLTGLRKPLTTP